MLQLIAIYLLKTIIVSAVLILYYWFALRNKRFHYYNRFYLLSAVVLSMGLPLLNLNLFTLNSNSDKAISMFNVMYASGETEIIFDNKTASFDWQQMVLLLSVAITAVLLLMLAYRIITIYRIKRKFPVSNMQEFDFVNTDLQQAPFSFLKNVFWRNDISLEENAGRLILQHELAHIEQKHTWDKLFMQVVIAVLWMNPLYRLIQKELYLIHEFIADDKSVTDKDTAAFAEMLLHVHYGKFNFDPAQPFFYSPIKRRLIMLTTSKEPRFSYVRRIMALPLLACVVLLFAFRLQKENNETVITTVNPGATFKLVVDAGHGGEDGGAVGINGTKEKDITLALSKKIKELSGEYGIEVVLTRDNDVYMTPPEKLAFSEKQNANAFISIHTNAATAKDQQVKSGMEIFVSPDNTHLNDSKILGSAVLQKLGSDFKVNTPLLMRKVGIWVLKSNPDPAILIECGYITNKEDLAILKDNAQVETMARKILEGVAAYANNSNSPIDPYEVKLQDANAFADTTTPDESPNIKIRNKDFITSGIPADVVFVVNGEITKESEVEKLDPNSIKSIEVLKDDEFAKSIYNLAGKKAVIIITTKDYQSKATITLKTTGTNAPLYIVDGNTLRADANHAEIPAENISSMNVLKDEDALKNYGEKGKNGVIIITTKDYKPKTTIEINTSGENAPVYVVDGNFITAEQLKISINPDDILSVNVLKGQQATKAYGDNGKNGVIEITTKNAAKK
ncbi:hypothetical protein BH10BAC2_BH10BAC2_13690 [soil metagenome]